MPYPNAETLRQSYAATQGLIERHCSGLTHGQSVVQPPFPGNCLNWVLGHVLNGRDRALRALGAQPVLSEGQYARYATGSEPIAKAGDGTPVEVLLELAQLSHRRLDSVLEQTGEEFLAEVVETQFGRQRRSTYVSGLHWHETYHTGQLEILRSLSLSAS